MKEGLHKLSTQEALSINPVNESIALAVVCAVVQFYAKDLLHDNQKKALKMCQQLGVNLSAEAARDDAQKRLNQRKDKLEEVIEQLEELEEKLPQVDWEPAFQAIDQRSKILVSEFEKEIKEINNWELTVGS